MDENGNGRQVIQIMGPMREAWEAGAERYTPCFRNETMDEERGAVEVSFKNLRRLVASGMKVCCMYARPNGVLVCFCGGFSYLATSFQVGRSADRSKLFGLAQFAAEVGLGDAEKIARHFGAFPLTTTRNWSSPCLAI